MRVTFWEDEEKKSFDISMEQYTQLQMKIANEESVTLTDFSVDADLLLAYITLEQAKTAAKKGRREDIDYACDYSDQM